MAAMKIDFLFDGPRDAEHMVVLAHGAGAAMDHGFMNTIAEGLGGQGIGVARFEFPYMAARRKDGKRRPPDRRPVLLDTWLEVIARLGQRRRLVIGGKSMGGRIASLVADRSREQGPGVAGLVCLGYPFFAPGRPEKPRIEHLAAIVTPTLIIQGERDPMGPRPVVEGYPLADSISIHWLGDGDHGLKPRKASGRTLEQNLAEAIRRIAVFVNGL